MLVTSPRGLAEPRVATNKNTNWLDNQAAWLFYVLLILVSWIVISTWTDPGMAWTYVHIIHGIISYYLFHWTKGSPIGEDQGKWDRYVDAFDFELYRFYRRTCFDSFLEYILDRYEESYELLESIFLCCPCSDIECLSFSPLFSERGIAFFCCIADNKY